MNARLRHLVSTVFVSGMWSRDFKQQQVICVPRPPLESCIHLLSQRADEIGTPSPHLPFDTCGFVVTLITINPLNTLAKLVPSLAALGKGKPSAGPRRTLV